MRGTASFVNQSMMKPLFYLGVERTLVVVNVLICYPLVAASYMQFPACLLGVGLFVINHAILTQLSKSDPIFAKVLKRNIRYSFQPYFPARSHPLQTRVGPVETVVRP